MAKLIWLDLETSGLDPKQHQILEAAVYVADFETPFQAKKIFHQVFPFALRDIGSLDPVVIKMHAMNGLFDECEVAFQKVRGEGAGMYRDIQEAEHGDIQEAEHVLHDLLSPLGPSLILAGSTVHFDRGFIKDTWPSVEKLFSHRHYDVSSTKLFCESLGMEKIPKGEAHRACEDVKESIVHASTCATWMLTKYGQVHRSDISSVSIK